MPYPLAAVRGGHAPAHVRGILGEEQEEHSTTYSDIVLAAGPVAYWPLWESSGTNAEELVGDNKDGTYNSDVSQWGTEEGIGDLNTAPTFDGTRYISINSAELNTVWDGDEFTIMLCCKYSAEVNEDGDTRRAIRLCLDGDNNIAFAKSTTASEFCESRKASGLYRAMWRQDIPDVTPWTQYALTMSLSENRQYGYVNGVQHDVETGLLMGWGEGSFNSAYTLIGAASTALLYPWIGSICHVAIFAQELPVESLLALLPPGIT